MTAPSPKPRVGLPCLVLTGLLGLQTANADTEDLKLLAPDGVAGDAFGAAVATDGSLVLVGAPEADDLGAESGTAYLLDSGTGALVHDVLPLDGAAGDRFGEAVAVDGGLAVVGAPSADAVGASSGAAYLFDTATGLQTLKLVPSDAGAGDQFGGAVALQGGLVVVGAVGADGVGTGTGAAYLFDATTGAQLHKLAPGDASFLGGFGNAVDLDGGRVLVGARTADSSTMLSGAAYLFDAATGSQTHKLQPQLAVAWASFGCSVGIDGDAIVIGARDEGPKGKHSGAAYLFDAASGQQTAKLYPADGGIFAKFGNSVGIDGDDVLIGSFQDNAPEFSQGSAYLYRASDGSQAAKLTASDGGALDDLGTAVAVAEGVLVAGAPRDDDLGDASGAAFVFTGGAAVGPMTGCLFNTGTLVHAAGLPVPGHTLTFILANGQPTGTAALLATSTAPVPGWPACGLDLGSAGELLIDLGPGSLLPLQVAAYAGSPVTLDTAVPPLAGLAGLTVHAQGAFLAPADPLEPLRLTSALELVLGGYL